MYCKDCGKSPRDPRLVGVTCVTLDKLPDKTSHSEKIKRKQ